MIMLMKLMMKFNLCIILYLRCTTNFDWQNQPNLLFSSLEKTLDKTTESVFTNHCLERSLS